MYSCTSNDYCLSYVSDIIAASTCDLLCNLFHIIQTKLTINTKTPAIKYLNTNNIKDKISSPPLPNKQ